jgi:hypothetical protein
MILRPVTPAVAVRPARDEASGRVHVDLRVLVAQAVRNQLVDEVLGQVLGDGRVRRVRGRAAWRTTTASTRTGLPLSYSTVTCDLPSGRTVLEFAVASRLRQAAHELVRQHDRQRHQFRSLRAGIAEHQALVAGAAGVHALADVARLLVNRRQHRARLGVEAVLAAGVADVLDDVADDLLEVDVALVVISPATIARPVVTSVSHATRATGSCARMASSTPSEI